MNRENPRGGKKKKQRGNQKEGAQGEFSNKCKGRGVITKKKTYWRGKGG